MVTKTRELKPLDWHPSPEPFICECERRVTTNDNILFLIGEPQMICFNCARRVLNDVAEITELKELYER